LALIRNIHEETMNEVNMPGVSGAKMAIMVGREDKAPNFALRSFEVVAGGHTPKHSHDYEHEVYVVSGNGQVLLEGKMHDIREGDVLYVPANEEHQFTVDADSGESLRFLCVVPVEQNCGGPVPGS